MSALVGLRSDLEETAPPVNIPIFNRPFYANGETQFPMIGYEDNCSYRWVFYAVSEQVGNMEAGRGIKLYYNTTNKNGFYLYDEIRQLSIGDFFVSLEIPHVLLASHHNGVPRHIRYGFGRRDTKDFYRANYWFGGRARNDGERLSEDEMHIPDMIRKMSQNGAFLGPIDGSLRQLLTDGYMPDLTQYNRRTDRGSLQRLLQSDETLRTLVDRYAPDLNQ